MQRIFSSRLIVLVVANVLFCCMLSFYQTSDAAPQGAGEPFANSVEQRGEMINHLKAIQRLLEDQNALLRSGNLKVVIREK